MLFVIYTECAGQNVWYKEAVAIVETCSFILANDYLQPTKFFKKLPAF